MDKFKNMAKGGWHPERDSGQSGGIRNQVKGWVGKSDKQQYTTYSEPYVRKDPSQFAPPPKTKVYGPNDGPPVPSPREATSKPEPEPDADAPPKRTGPFVANTTGIDVSRFPKPPPRTGTAGNGESTSVSPKPTAKPPLPPRLPPRNKEAPDSASHGLLNEAAVGRLGTAGITVPGLGIGTKRPPPPLPARSPSGPGPSTTANASPPTGTTWAQKRAALKTIGDIRNDPGSVSMSEIRSSAATAKNFHERHGNQVAAAAQVANQVGQNYSEAQGTAGSSEGGKRAPPPIPVGTKPRLPP